MKRSLAVLCLAAAVAATAAARAQPPAAAPAAARDQPPAPAPAATTTAATVARYDLRSGFWVSLHQTLYAVAFLGAEAPWVGEAEQGGWDAAVAAYRERFARASPLFDHELIVTNDTLSGVGDGAALPELPRGMAEVLAAAAPAYRARWPVDDRVNRFWVAMAAALLAEAGEELVVAHEEAYGTAYPDRIVVDAAPHGGRVGAYTTIRNGLVHATIASPQAALQGFAALEMLLHEPSHAVVGDREGEIGPEIVAASRELGVEVPRDLWHAVLFRTSGELTRRALAARGVDYTPYAQAHDVFSRWLSPGGPLEGTWDAYLAGGMSREEAIRRLVTAAAGPPPAGG